MGIPTSHQEDTMEKKESEKTDRPTPPASPGAPVLRDAALPKAPSVPKVQLGPPEPKPVQTGR